MNQQEMAKHLGEIGEYVTGYIKNAVEQNSDDSDKLYLNARYEYGYFAIYLFNGLTANTICKKWPMKEFISLCGNNVKREVVFQHTAKELINRSKGKKCDKIVYI